MDFNLDLSLQLLRQTPYTLQRMLDGLSEEWTHVGGSRDDWSPYDILGHLIHGEQTDWMTRAEIILAQGENKIFQTFDRLAQFEESKGKTLDDLLTEFAHLRAANLERVVGWQLDEQKLDPHRHSPDFRRGHASTAPCHVGRPRPQPHPPDRPIYGAQIRVRCRTLEGVPDDPEVISL